MYISLKWKAVVFLSIVLVSITVTLTWQIIAKQLENFDAELEQSQANQEILLKELLDDNFLKLSQFSELIATQQYLSSVDDKNVGNSQNIKQSLQNNWLSFHINLGLDYLAIFDRNRQKLGEVYAPAMPVNEKFQNTILGKLHEKTLLNEPSNMIYCDHACYLIVVQTFIGKLGEQGTIVLAQNMAEIVKAFYDFSNSGVGILINQGSDTKSIPRQRYLPDWKYYAWAISDFDRVFPILRKYSKSHAVGGDLDKRLFTENAERYLVAWPKLKEIPKIGFPFLLVTVEEKSIVYETVIANIRRAAITAGVGLLAAELILLLMIMRPMKKLSNITEALHHLPQQNFRQAVARVSGNNGLFTDELSTLETSTTYVALELEKLHKEINEKNISLEKQVHALTRSRAFLTRLFDNSQVFITTQDFDYHIHSTNKMFEAQFDKLPTRFVDLFNDESELDEFKEKCQSLIKHQRDAFQHQFHLFDKYHKKLAITWTHTLVEDEQGSQVILSIGMDQTLQKKAENELRWLANHDGLTSIGNRRSFNASFSQMLENNIPGALVFIDVNRFKQINDIYGHSAGDQVLIDIASKLLKLTRTSDSISRFAGDEFTILMANITQEALPIVLNKLAEKLNSSIQTEKGRVIQYSVSIGASTFPQQGSDTQNLIINADQAMYHAKKKGVGQWHIFDDNDERITQIKQDHNLILAIRHALKTDDFNLFYQPILDIRKNRVSHYEVLIRLADKKGNNISPAVFIPLAEKTGEIQNIDEWVLEHALKSLHENELKGELYTIAINISAPTLQANEFPQLLFKKIKKYEIDFSKIIIELTETAYIENFQQVLKNLNLITKKGVKVALDDFGVGFSSFTYLKMLPLSYVKLDGSYIRNLTHNPDDQVFVKSLSAMVSAFGMKVIAEFVEDRETLTMIEKLGVTHGQGYYIGKPQPIDQECMDEKQGVQ
jgi:diguanylate cyclase (GGDEF)-like protein